MSCYYHKHIPAPPTCITLDEHESLHAATSRRQRRGDEVIVIDGKGTRASGMIDHISRAAVKVRIHTRSHMEKQKPDIILASALPKGERQKTMLNMITQLGVTVFVPLECERSVVNPASVNVTRWARIFVEACKQSHNPFFPSIEQSAPPVEFVATMRQHHIPVWVADPAGGDITSTAGPNSVAVCIGPEGGFTDSEKNAMLAAGVTLFRLGSNILRTETAAVAAVSIIRQFCSKS